MTVLSRWNGHNLQLKKGSSDIDRSNIERTFTLNVKKPDDYRMHNIIHMFLHVSIIVVGFVLQYNLPVFFHPTVAIQNLSALDGCTHPVRWVDRTMVQW